ncbi:MAG: protease HtpX [Deltaproteobacteria bacterium]|nr:MAG: protease HtpX [Deltaproteobacteria bacterium]
MKRVLLFLATNIAVMIVLSISATLLEGFLAARGVHIPQQQLLVYAFVFGMGGSFISLLLSKWMAIRATGAQVISESRNDAEAWLLQTVSHHAQAAGIGMPQVAIFPSDSPNAFATGARRDNALVAVSTGLLERMNRAEVAAVLGHEVTHIANGDMVTLALIQGVLNTFVILLSRVIGGFVDRVVFRNEGRGRGFGYVMVVIATQILLGILASMIVFWFSRRREFRADGGGARLAGRDGMISALRALQRETERQPLPEQMRAFGITSPSGVMRLFMSHPPLEERIAALQTASSL